ncbi:MAG: pyruvate kinase [Candidatus Saccharimonadales bacterium]
MKDTKKQPIFKRTKIIATVGPATDSYDKIKALIDAGANGLRLNFSHESYEAAERHITWIRRASKELKKPVAIFQDLQGPKIRLGEIKNNFLEVKNGNELKLQYEATHDGLTLPTQYDLSNKVKPGERVYIFDGKVRCVATAVDPAERSITVRVEHGGVVMSRKGINLPDTDFSGDILTEKDYRDIDWGATRDIDYVGLSFVHSAHDIEVLRGYMAEQGSDALIIAKIETKSAIEDEELEHIVEASDAVMVARGDLAVEIGAEIVPVVQRRIIELCHNHATLSIVATQMMMSMVTNPEPTRAEVTDVSHAVVVGADCVMLSDETANGEFPIETVESMKRIIMYTQTHIPVRPLGEPQHLDTHAAAISAAAVTLARQLQADAIVAETKTGATAQHIAAHRPGLPIISVTSDARTAQQLAMLYANKSFLRPDGERAGLVLAKELVESEYLARGSTVVLVSGRQPGIKGVTDTIRVRTIE